MVLLMVFFCLCDQDEVNGFFFGEGEGEGGVFGVVT